MKIQRSLHEGFPWGVELNPDDLEESSLASPTKKEVQEETEQVDQSAEKPILKGKKKGAKTRNDPLQKQSTLSKGGSLDAKSMKNLKQSPLRKAFTRKSTQIKEKLNQVGGS